MLRHLVRPHLDCASRVWSPHQEAVQHRATKLMVGNRVSYKERLNKTTLFFFFYKNIFYKNIEAEICEILRIF